VRRVAPVVAAALLVAAAVSPASAALRYTVAPGDTLFRIALRFGVSLPLLARANGLRDPSRIRVGLVLWIPDPGTPVRAPRPSRFAPPSAAVPTERPLSAAPQGPGASAPGVTPDSSYVVRSGDTLYRIASSHGLTVAALQQANALSSPDLIRPGEVLRIPVPGRASPGTSWGAGAEIARRVVAQALRYLGTPYRWGGEGPSGVDCSGLVSLVYSPYVPHFPRSTYDQWTVGVVVDRAALAPGDLVFFDTDGSGPSHVGIYVGADRFVHPSASAGRVVVDLLTEPYYASRYLGARRVL
jgi:peptidoglycan endopeptidase LytE